MSINGRLDKIESDPEIKARQIALALPVDALLLLPELERRCKAEGGTLAEFLAWTLKDAEAGSDDGGAAATGER